jgi:hypothetical protein
MSLSNPATLLLVDTFFDKGVFFPSRLVALQRRIQSVEVKEAEVCRRRPALAKLWLAAN